MDEERCRVRGECEPFSAALIKGRFGCVQIVVRFFVGVKGLSTAKLRHVRDEQTYYQDMELVGQEEHWTGLANKTVAVLQAATRMSGTRFVMKVCKPFVHWQQSH